MSMQRMLGVVSVACALSLVACDEELEAADDAGEVEEDPAETRDAGHRPDANGDSHQDPDHGDEPEGRDAGMGATDAAADAGAAPDSALNDAALADGATGSTDGGTPTSDAGANNDSGANDAGAKGVHFFLPTVEPDNTSAPTVEVDSAGNTHSVFPAYAGGDAYYSFCANDGTCKDSASAKVVHFQTDGTVANAMLALTKDGKPRILLSSFSKIYWGACDQNCTERQNWTFASILDHQGKRQVTGEALALDGEGRPRFLMHTYRALWGIGQQAPEEIFARCDAGCETPESWNYSVIEQEIWEGSHLRFDAQGRPHVATTVIPFEGTSPKDPMTAYLHCDAADCTALGSFRGIGFVAPYESMTEAISMTPAVSLALTKAGAPRIALIGKSQAGKKQLLYFACNSNCKEAASWSGTLLTEHDVLGAGVDLALDANDHPRLVYTFNYNILLRFCDSNDCTVENAGWDDALVEAASNIPPDKIFLWENCTIGAWFLHDPSIALTSQGIPRVGYQARDISGGFTRPDPTKPGCTPGTDMTFARLALMTGVQ